MRMMERVRSYDAGLPEQAVRRRRRSKRFARMMLIIAGFTAMAGWAVFGTSIFSAIQIREQSPYQAIVAYALLIVSSVTLVLGLWYLLLAQVERVARIVGVDEAEEAPAGKRCGNCGWTIDAPDRFCRHCGTALGEFDAVKGKHAERAKVA